MKKEILQKDLAKLPITALALWRCPSTNRLYVLSGEDADLVVYHDAPRAAAESGRQIRRVSIFADQPVHGIHVQRGRDGQAGVLLWGSSSVAYLRTEDLIPYGRRELDEKREQQMEDSVRVARIKAPDWIYDAAISPYDPYLAILATAHNETILLRCCPQTRTLHLSKPVAPSRPMLYSACVRWTSDRTVLVAGGTVFGHIVVWKLELSFEDGADAGSKTTILFNLQGHEGSIFDVDVSPMLTLADGSLVRLLASCSDDRTVRVWDITERGEPDEPLRTLTPDREIDTGFRHIAIEDSQSTENTESGGIAPIACVMGHASRIWGVKFSSLRGDNVLPIYSFGEDSTTQRWLLTLSVSGEFQDNRKPSSKIVTGAMKHDGALSLHDGKHLWSNAVLAEEDYLLIATGGADSQINLIQEESTQSGVSTPAPTHSITVDVHEIFKSMPNPSQAIGPKEIISRYDFVSSDQILLTTSQGRLLVGNLTTCVPSWQEISLDDAVSADMKLCYVLKSVASGSALLGMTNGNLYHFNLSTLTIAHVTLLEGKPVEISNLSLHSKSQGLNNRPIEVLVHLHGKVDCPYLTIHPTSGILISREQIKGLDPRFVITAASKIGDSLFVGSRHGYLSILRRDAETTYRPVLDLATRSRDSITLIIPLPPSSDSATHESSYVLIASRDGKYRIYEIEQGTWLLHLRHETSPPFGPVIAGAWFTPGETPELILYGFKSKNFVIWNESRKEELASIECGGAHRTFQLLYDEVNPSRYRFAFTKTSKLSLFSSERSTHRLIKSGVHGREVKALCASGKYIASGSEDTTIRIWKRVTSGEGSELELECVATMKAHVTGLQKLLWYKSDYLFSSAGNEEFFVWRVRELETKYDGLAVFCEGVFVDKTAVGDLRIMDFDVCQSGQSEELVITMAFSNSTLKAYRYTSALGTFELLAQGSYTGACLTQVRHFGIRQDYINLLTASTDGHIALWCASATGGATWMFALQEVAPLHQNTIKSLDMMKVGEEYLVFTGGDDNGVGITSIAEKSNTSANPTWQVSKRNFVSKAHAAAVTGVALTRRDADVIGVSASNDQRIKAWRLFDNEGRIGLLSQTCTGVADVGDITLMSGLDPSCTTLIVGGVGIEAWSLRFI